jgi:hypothetical protein
LQDPLKAEAQKQLVFLFFLGAAAFLSALALASAFFAWVSGQPSFLARHSSS